MANSSFDIVSSISAPNSRRYYPSPTNSRNISVSFTASPSYTNLRDPPASPFSTDQEHSWREEISWQIEPSERFNYPKTLGSALSPWGWSSSSPGLSQRFRRTANHYYLSRTYGPPHPHHENGKPELRSYAASESEIGNSGRGKKSALAEEDELSMMGYNTEVDLDVLYRRDDDGSYYYGGYSYNSDYEEKEKVSTDEEDGGGRVGVMGLFRYSTKWDWVLVMVGCVGAIINGGSLPCYSYLFGELVNKIAAESLAGHQARMIKDVQQVILLFILIFFSPLTPRQTYLIIRETQL